MTSTRTLFVALAACALGVAPAFAQDHQSKTEITITDDGKKRHIVVVKDGKVVKDEWTTSEPGKGDYNIVRVGKDGQYRLERGTGNIVIGRDGKSTTVRAGTLRPGKDNQFHLETGKDGVTIVRDGNNRTVTVQGGAATARAGKNGEYRLDRTGAHTNTVIARGQDGRFHTVPDVSVRSQMTRGQDIAKLLNSLTFDQREKQHDKGYLTLEDLTPQQRRLFVAPKGDNWTVSYEIDGNRVTIRSR